jgi:RpiR family carbohydrate utilization transcriptional regulator
LRSQFSKSEKRVADAILSTPQQCVKITMKDLARTANVSEPTIVRFCRTLKLSGYREFRLRLAQDLASQVHYQQSKIDSNDSSIQLVDKVLNGAIASLTTVRNQLVPQLVDKAIEVLSSSRRIEIYGIGGAGIVVSDAQLKFARLGLNSQPCCDVHLQRIAAAMLESDDCVLAISNSGRSKDLISSIKIAKLSGAKVIAITASGSPLAAISDIHLAIDLNQENDHLAPIKARIAHMAVVDILATGVAVRCKPDYLERLRQANIALSDKFESDPG